MNVLFLTGAAPPAGGSHATRVAAFVEKLASSGVNVSLLTVRWPDSMRLRSSLFKRLLEVCDVEEISGGFLRRSADAVRERATPHSQKPLAGFFSRLLNPARVLARKALVPDSFVGWIPLAVISGLRKSKQGCDAIVSSGAPFSSHIAAAIISRYRRVPLILDNGDPWVYEPSRPRSGLRLMLERLLERLVLQQAHYVCVTTEATRALYVEKFPEVPDKYVVLPMGFNSSDYNVERAGVDKAGCEMRFVYAGRLTNEHRSLDGLALLLRQVAYQENPPVFEFYGDENARVVSELSEYFDKGVVRVFPSVDHAGYTQLLSQADCLMVFGNNNFVQVPGKIAQVIGARRPVLYFPNVADYSRDPALSLLRLVMRTGLFVADANTNMGVLLGEVSASKVDVNCAEYDALEWDAISSKLYRLVCSVVSQQT